MEQTLRWLAALGPIVVLITDLMQDGGWESRQGHAVGVLFLTVIATGLALRLLLPEETRRIRQHLDLP